MMENEIPSSVINSPSSVFITNQVGVDLTAFDRMESSSIVRSLFGIGATDPTAIDISTCIEACVDPDDQYKIRSLLSDQGVSGIIWRFVHANKFMVELSKSWDNKGENFLSLSLITLNEQTEQEPASTTVRELVRFGHAGVKFFDKSLRRTVRYDFSVTDFLQQLHDENVEKIKKEDQKGVEKEAMPAETVKAKSTTLLGDPAILKKHRDTIIKFCNENDHVEIRSNELGKLINCDVSINLSDEGIVVNVLKDNSVSTIKYVVQVFGDETLPQETISKLETELQNDLPNNNYRFEPTSIMHAMRQNGMKLNVWGFDTQEEHRTNTETNESLCIYKVKFDRIVVPHAKKFEFVCLTDGVGLEIVDGMKDIECDLPINYDAESVVLTINGIFHSKSIKDYVATHAELVGSTDLDDLTSARTWKVSFEMTPEALETEKTHTVNKVEEEKLKEQEYEAAMSTVVIFEGEQYYIRKNGNCEGTEADVITIKENVAIATFCDPNVKDYQFNETGYSALHNITPMMLRDNSFGFIMDWFKPNPPKMVDVPSIVKTEPEESTESLLNKPTDQVTEPESPSEEQHEEVAPVEEKNEEINEEPKKEEEPMEELKIEVCETLKDCQEAIVSALKEILAEYGDDASNNVLSIETKLVAATEMDDIKLSINETGWFVDQQVPEPEEEQVPPAEEVQSADIRNQEVQMNLLRGIFEVADPAVTHVQKFLRKHLTEINHDGYLLTETFPTETMISWDTKPYDFTISIVKFKDGRFYRIFLAYTNPGLPDQTWMATKDIPGRWVKIGRDIQTNEFKPNFQGRRNSRY